MLDAVKKYKSRKEWTTPTGQGRFENGKWVTGWRMQWIWDDAWDGVLIHYAEVLSDSGIKVSRLYRKGKIQCAKSGMDGCGWLRLLARLLKDVPIVEITLCPSGRVYLMVDLGKGLNRSKEWWKGY
jgi:hypothetical protein